MLECCREGVWEGLFEGVCEGVCEGGCKCWSVVGRVCMRECATLQILSLPSSRWRSGHGCHEPGTGLLHVPGLYTAVEYSEYNCTVYSKVYTAVHTHIRLYSEVYTTVIHLNMTVHN